MARANYLAHAVAERAALLELLESLTPTQWEQPSLCAGWSVRQVAAHVISYDGLSRRETVALFLRGGLRPGRINEVALEPYATATSAQLLEELARGLRPSGLPAALGAGIALTDGTIHQQDIRRALDLPRTIQAKQLTAVLDFSLTAPTLPSRRNARGLRLVADDIDWTHGDGPEVNGPGESLLMATAGRADALNSLGGPGADVLVERIRASTST